MFCIIISWQRDCLILYQILKNLTHILNEFFVVGLHFMCTGFLQRILQSAVRYQSEQSGSFWFKFFGRAVSVSQMKGKYISCFAFHNQWNTQSEESVFILLCLHLQSIVNNQVNSMWFELLCQTVMYLVSLLPRDSKVF